MKEKENTFAKTAGRMITDERGVFAVIFALMLLVLLGFMALGVEAGRWYLVRAELSKGVDAAALAAARNIGGMSIPWSLPTSSETRISGTATWIPRAPGWETCNSAPPCPRRTR